MRCATKTAAQTLGVYAELVALEHDVAEILQGDLAPAGLPINRGSQFVQAQPSTEVEGSNDRRRPCPPLRVERERDSPLRPRT